MGAPERLGRPASADPVELAWAAGFFDGEGSIYINRQRTVRKERPGKPVYTIISPSVSICQVDRRPLDRWVAAVGVGVGRGPYKPKTKNSQPYYRVEWRGRQRAHRAMVTIWPYLSEPKREQARRIWDEVLSLSGKKSPPLPPLPEM